MATLIVIAGLPSSGKSTLIDQIKNGSAHQELRSLVLSQAKFRGSFFVIRQKTLGVQRRLMG